MLDPLRLIRFFQFHQLLGLTLEYFLLVIMHFLYIFVYKYIVYLDQIYVDIQLILAVNYCLMRFHIIHQFLIMIQRLVSQQILVYYMINIVLSDDNVEMNGYYNHSVNVITIFFQ